jgi:hypothetical protein
MKCTLDHLVVVADTLDQGEDYIRQVLGVPLETGGKHVTMGTHNRLLRLGTDAYLEVIAIDPDAPAPDRPRWFQLDDPALRVALKERPRLIHWVAATDDLQAALAACPVVLGEPVELSRGDFRWTFALSADGSMPFGGVGPDLIQWQGSAHPAKRLKNTRCSVTRMTATHPDADAVRNMLNALKLSALLKVEPGESVGLRALIQTPRGARWLS